MSQRDTSGATGGGTDDTEQRLAETGSEYVPEPGTLKRAATSGTAAGLGAGAAIVSGLRAISRGDLRSGFTRFVVGGSLAMLAVAQRRSGRGRSGVEETDVVDTSPDVEGAVTSGATGDEGPDRATGEEASEVVDTAPDVEGVDTGPDVNVDDPDVDVESGSGGVDQTDVVDTGVGGEEETMATDVAGAASDEAAEVSSEDATPADEPGAETRGGEGGTAERPATGDYERLGEAAFDEQSGRVPAPQEAFNLELLSSGAEAFWGVHEGEEALVVVSVEFDPIEETGEFRYVASSEIDEDDRGVRVPDTVLNHWDDVAEGGTAVTSGTGIVFLLVDDLQDEGLLVVVPEQWAEEFLEEMEE